SKKIDREWRREVMWVAEKKEEGDVSGGE
ncbi:hypothetical protein CCACVL1_04216, partial [Corchorus capsularis]